MQRIAWTDERLDERMQAMELRFDRIDAELREIRVELATFRHQMVQIGFGLVGVLIAALTTLAVTLAVVLA